MNLDSFLRVIFFYTETRPNYSSIHFEGEKMGVRGQERVFFSLGNCLSSLKIFLNFNFFNAIKP